MKKYIAIAALIAVSTLTACVGSKDSWNPLVESATPVEMKVTVPETRTELPSGDTVVTPAHEEIKTVDVKTVTVNPKWSSSIQTLQGVNSAVNPTPFAPLINLFFMAATGVLGTVAALKNKQVTAGKVLVQAIEGMNNPAVKEQIEKSVAVFGDKAAANVDKFVQTVTAKPPTLKV